jgi:hypothetical protein
MSKPQATLPKLLAESLAQSKRLTTELLTIKQDLDIAVKTPTRDNLGMLTARARLLKLQLYALEFTLHSFTARIDVLGASVSFETEETQDLGLALLSKAVLG